MASSSSSSNRPQSVRGLYTPPAEEWVFLPPSVSPPSTSSPAPSTPVHLPTPFSPAGSGVGGSFGSSGDAEIAGVGGLLSGPLQLFAAEFCGTAIGMPFEVGKTLLQIEYRPRKRFAPESLGDVDGEGQRRGSAAGTGRDKEKAEEQEMEDEDAAAAYFSDRLSGSTGNAYIPAPDQQDLPDIQVDSNGYLADPEPSWLLKDDFEISRGNGVWGMLRRIRYTPGEGVPALWKGQMVTTLHSIISGFLQPSIHSSLSGLFAPGIIPDIPLSALPAPALPLGLHVASHLLTHLILSPLEIIRTRLIVMPLGPKTPSSFGLCSRMVSNEGGLSSLYLHPNLLFPALLEHTLRPLLTLSIPILLERQFGISPDLNPITYSLCDLSLNLASLVVLLPIETVRRRLQIQSRGGDKERIRTVVQTRPREYVGIVEAMWRIVTEETGVRRRRVMSEKDEGGVLSGMRQLYRGFGMAATAHVAVFGLGLVSASLGGRGFDGGWKEI